MFEFQKHKNHVLNVLLLLQYRFLQFLVILKRTFCYDGYNDNNLFQQMLSVTSASFCAQLQPVSKLLHSYSYCKPDTALAHTELF